MKLHGVLRELASTLNEATDPIQSADHQWTTTTAQRVADALEHLANGVGEVDLVTLDEELIVDTLRTARIGNRYTLEVQPITEPSAMGVYAKLGTWRETTGIYDDPEHVFQIARLTNRADIGQHYCYRIKLTDPRGNERWGAVFTQHDLPHIAHDLDLEQLSIFVPKMHAAPVYA